MAPTTRPGLRVATVALAGAIALGACGASKAPVATGGDADRGAAIIKDVGCGGCHTIPGVRGARGTVGPPLDAFAKRTYIGGQAPNTPDNLVRWLRDPPAMEPGTAMPAIGLSEQQARDIAAYLYTLS
jgi:cytochrome c2